MSLVWIVSNGHVLMGKQAPGKKLAGTRIGFGGKCEEGESTIDCAKREIQEELNKIFPAENFKHAGKFTVSEKLIDCFVVESSEMFTPPNDNNEFVDVKWIPLHDLSKYYYEMLPGDEQIVENMVAYIVEGKEFNIIKEDTEELKNATKNIFN